MNEKKYEYALTCVHRTEYYDTLVDALFAKSEITQHTSCAPQLKRRFVFSQWEDVSEDRSDQ